VVTHTNKSKIKLLDQNTIKNHYSKLGVTPTASALQKVI